MIIIILKNNYIKWVINHMTVMRVFFYGLILIVNIKQFIMILINAICLIEKNGKNIV